MMKKLIVGIIFSFFFREAIGQNCFTNPANVVVASAGTVCVGGSLTLSLATTYTGGVNYQWYASQTSSVGPWVPVAYGGNSSTYNPLPIGINAFYTADITCVATSSVIVAYSSYISSQQPNLASIPYSESFNSISTNNQYPNCYWSVSSFSNSCLTSGSLNCAAFYYMPSGTNYFWSSPVDLYGGVVYSASINYKTDNTGAQNWSNLSLLLGRGQATTGLVPIASSTGAVASPSFVALTNTFSLPSSSMTICYPWYNPYWQQVPGYNFCIQATGSSTGASQYLYWDDLNVTAPCSLNPVSLTVTPNNTLFCSNVPIVLGSVSGAHTYTWGANVATGQTVNLNALGQSNLYVVGTNTQTGCTSSVAINASVLVTPSISIVGNTTICHGSGTTFTLSGGSAYTLNPGGLNSNFYLLPLNSTNYTVTASNTSNSCIATNYVSVNVNTACAMVWPGDANRDGLVSNLDVLELGLASGATGAARTTTGNIWTAQYASAWIGTVSTGWNKVHADCNGDGAINTNDNGAITANFGLTHSFKNSNISANPDITIVPQQPLAFEGIWNKADIVLGDTANTMSQFYGVAFDLNYDQSKVQTDSVKINYTASFFNVNNTNIDFGKTIFTNGKLYCASVRTDHANISGNGKIGEFWYKVKTGLPINSSIAISTSNAQKVNMNGVFNTLTNDAGTTVNISNNITGLGDKFNSNLLISFYPNPANNIITLRNELNIKTLFHVFDLNHRMILSGEFNSSKTLDVSSINKGVYILEFETPLVKIRKKLVKE